jgi:hypothetical protein
VIKIQKNKHNDIMKKTIFRAAMALGLLIFLLPSAANSQGKIEISPFGGYMFGGKMRFYEGDLKINDNANYGLTLDIELAPDTKLELLWAHMNTQAQFIGTYSFDYLTTPPFDIGVGYIQIGSVREINYDKIRPFGAFTLGTTYFLPGTNTGEVRYDDTWKFSVTLGGGAKIWFTERVGIRLQGRLMLPMFWGGAGFTVGTGGSGFTVGAGTSMAQGDFTGALIIALGD